MNFREIRQNSPLYLLNKESLTFEEVKADGVGLPHFAAPQVGQSSPTGQVIDITIKGQQYVVGCDNSVAYSDKVVFATDRAALLPEVRRLKADAETLLAGVTRAEETVSRCTALLCELDTAFKERQETDRRFGAMEGKINALSDMLRGFIDEFKK